MLHEAQNDLTKILSQRHSNHMAKLLATEKSSHGNMKI